MSKIGLVDGTRSQPSFFRIAFFFRLGSGLRGPDRLQQMVPFSGRPQSFASEFRPFFGPYKMNSSEKARIRSQRALSTTNGQNGCSLLLPCPASPRSSRSPGLGRIAPCRGPRRASAQKTGASLYPPPAAKLTVLFRGQDLCWYR
jgi:hypothetical protein